MFDLLRGHVERAHARSRRVYSLPAQARRRCAVSDVLVVVPGLVALEADSQHLGGSDDGSRWSLGALPRDVPLFRFTGSNRPSVVHVRRSIDIDFPEIVSYALRQRLMVHGAVADRTLPDPGVAAEEDGWTPAEEHEDIQDDVAFADGAWNENAAVFTPCWPWTPTTLRPTTKW